MAKKLTKKIKIRPMLASKDQLEVTKVVITSQDLDIMEKLRSTCIGDAHKAGNYGNGPLAYEGVQNLSESIFVGTSKVDSSRKLAVFKDKGVTQFSSILSSDNRRDELNKCVMTKASCEFQTDLPVSLRSEGLTTSNTNEYLRKMAQEFNNQTGKKSIRVAFNEKKQQLEVGSATSRRIILTMEPVESGKITCPMVVVVGDFAEAQAKNLLEASKLHPANSLTPAIAASILDLLSSFPGHELIEEIRRICSTYPVGDVSLTKRDRNKLNVKQLHSKVIYTRSGLKSCIKNLQTLEPDVQAQYLPVFSEFTKDLVELARVHPPAIDIVNAVRTGLGYKASSTVSKAPKDVDDSTVTVAPQVGEG